MKYIFTILAVLMLFSCKSQTGKMVNKGQIEQLEDSLNKIVIAQLLKAGDDLTKERNVQHWIYFKSVTDRRAYWTRVSSMGYAIDDTTFVNGEFGLIISKVQAVKLEVINPVTVQLKVEAQKFNGDYDGWETAVIK